MSREGGEMRRRRVIQQKRHRRGYTGVGNRKQSKSIDYNVRRAVSSLSTAVTLQHQGLIASLARLETRQGTRRRSERAHRSAHRCKQ